MFFDRSVKGRIRAEDSVPPAELRRVVTDVALMVEKVVILL